MASRQDDLLVRISEMEKYLAKISEMENSPGKILEMEKSLGQLFDWTKSITEELSLLRPIPPVTTPIPISTVIDGSPKHEAINVCPSLHVDSEDASMTVNQGEARSVYLLVSSYGPEYANAIYEVKFKHGVGVTHEPPLVGLVAKFHEGLCFQAARNFNSSKLYCLVQEGGYIIDTKTKSICSSISPTLAPKSIATVVCAYDKIYCVASPSGFLPIPEPSFERYDPNQDIWEKMPSFPFYNDYDTCMDITGYAVCYGVILFSLCGMKENSFDVVAFHESRNLWNRVKVDTSIHYAPFDGRAVVVGKTIYALHGEEFIAFSFNMDKDDDCDITYSLRKLFILRGLEIASPPWPYCDYQTEYLVHLGNRDFFHVKTGYCDISLGVQYLCITTFQIVVGDKGKDMIKTINSTVHSVEIKEPHWFGLVFCFTSECRDYEPTLDELGSTLDENYFLVEGKRRTMTKKEGSKKGITTRKLEIPARLHEIGNDGGISISNIQIGIPNIQIQKPWIATT